MAQERTVGKRPLLDRFGDAVARSLDVSPRLARACLGLGFGYTGLACAHLPDRTCRRSANLAAHLCLDVVSRAYARIGEAAITSIFLPTEVFQALGVRPLTAEALGGMTGGGHAEAPFVAAADAAGIPDSYCSYHRVLMGMAAADVLGPPRMLASCTVACDANNLTFKALGRRWPDAARIYVDVPLDVSEDSALYVADQLREMARMAEDAFGRRLDEADLVERVGRSRRTLETLARTLPERAGRAVDGTLQLELEQMVDVHVCLGTPGAEAWAEELERELATAPRFDGLSILWTHTSPFFVPELAEWLDRGKQVQVVASDMVFDQLPPEEGEWWFDEGHPYECMAERLVRDSLNGPAARRAAHVLSLAQRTSADGIVVFCHWGCRHTAGASQLLRATLERAGYPVLVLDGDGCERANNMGGQMGTRFGAFVELMRARRDVAGEGEAVA